MAESDMNPKTTKKVGSAVRLVVIIRDVISGIMISIAMVAFGILSYIPKDNEGKHSMTTLLILSVLALFVFIWTFVLLARRLSQSKHQSTNVAYQATDGNVAINKTSSLQGQAGPDQLKNETVEAWAGPVFSNQNTHIVWIGVDSSPNTENTLIVTESYLLGLLIGPSSDSNSFITNALNILPIPSTQKNAFGSVFDKKEIKQNIVAELGRKQPTQLAKEYSGFIIPITEIENVSMDGHSIKMTFKDGSRRSWLDTTRADELSNVCHALQAKMQNTNS